MSEQSLKGYFAVVTGASSGIGWAVTHFLLEEGVQVAGLARRVELMQEKRETLLPELAKAFHPIACDLNCLESIKQAFQEVERRFKRLHILICNAGTMEISRLLDAGNESALEKTMNVNFMGVVHSVKQAYPLLLKSLELEEPCTVLNVMSLLAHRIMPHIPEAGLNLYPVSKHAVHALQEVLRREFQKHKLLRLTSISPGLVDTDFVPDGLQIPEGVLKAEDVARGIMFILKSPPHVTIAELHMIPSIENY